MTFIRFVLNVDTFGYLARLADKYGIPSLLEEIKVQSLMSVGLLTLASYHLHYSRAKAPNI